MQILKLMKIYYDFCMVALRKQHKLWLQHITKVRLCDGASGIVFRSWKEKKKKRENSPTPFTSARFSASPLRAGCGGQSLPGVLTLFSGRPTCVSMGAACLAHVLLRA